MCVHAKMMVKDVSVVYKMRVLEHFTLWGIFGLAVLAHFAPLGYFLGLMVLAHFELYQGFVY